MVLKKKYGFSRSKRFSRSFVGTKRQKRTMVGRSLLYNNPLMAYRIKRIATGTTSQYQINSSGAGNTYRAWSFSLDQVPNPSEFTNLFDSYKIDKVVVKFQAVGVQQISSEYSNGAGAVSYQPRTYTAVDYDDDTVPTALTELTQYSNCKQRLAGRNFSITIRPKVAVQVYRSAVLTAYANPDKTVKLDCAYSDVPHFGLKFAMTQTSTNNQFNYDVSMEYYCSFYGIR